MIRRAGRTSAQPLRGRRLRSRREHAELINLGWSAIGVESDEVACRIASERGVPVARGDARMLHSPTRASTWSYPLTWWEHIEEDHLVAREAFRVLRPGGVARRRALRRGAVERLRRSARPCAALRTATANALIVDAGFTVDQLWSWDVHFSARRPRGASPQRVESEMAPVNPVLNWGLRTALRVERHLPVRSLPGISTGRRGKEGDVSAASERHWVADPRLFVDAGDRGATPAALGPFSRGRLAALNARLRPGAEARFRLGGRGPRRCSGRRRGLAGPDPS